MFTPVENSVPFASDEDMSATERDLAEDAQWKRIQQNTFTRWANEHLKNAHKFIENLETDLADGLKLVALIEVLSGRRLPRHNKKPHFRSQKLENVSVALKFLEISECIKIVNIDSTDIVDCKLKLILGLIWTLILHYSISIPMWEGEENLNEKNSTPKQRLMHWIQSKIPELPVSNFTSDWNDGRAVGALVDAFEPGLCPDWPDWSPENATDNVAQAMDLAQDWLGVPQLITPEELVNPNCDELSMMTYLSQYPNAKLKPGAPIKPRSNFSKVKCYGPGIEPHGVLAGEQTHFTIDTFSAGKGKIEAYLKSPDGSRKPIDIQLNNEKNQTYFASYTANVSGEYSVIVKFNGTDVPKSPFHVNVKGGLPSASMVTASGPGLNPAGVVSSKPTYFDIFSKDAGKKIPEVMIVDPSYNQKTAVPKIKQMSEGVYRCEYTPSVSGLHSINVLYDSQPIPNSPFAVKIAPGSDPSRVRASGRGLQQSGVRVKDGADFKVYTENAGVGDTRVKIIGPGGISEHALKKAIDEHTTEFTYYPKKEGKYTVIVYFNDKEIPKSPFEVHVGPYKEAQIKAFGPGLETGVVGHPAIFTAETNGETGSLGFSIEGPSQARIDCFDNGDGSADIKYFPTAPGEYAVHILCDNEDIPGSPYIAQILPRCNYSPKNVKCYGPGLEKNGVITNSNTQFTVNTKEAGEAPLDVQISDETYKPVSLTPVNEQDGVYEFSYKPVTAGKHIAQITYGGVAVNGSPFRVFVNEPTNPGAVKVFGPGVDEQVTMGRPTYFKIDCRDAGPGDLQIALTNENDRDIPLNIDDNGDGTFKVEYQTPFQGLHKISVIYGESEVPQSPLLINVLPEVNVNRVKVDGLEESVFADTPSEFTVDTRSLDTPQGKVNCIIKNPSGLETDSLIQTLPDGTYRITYTPFEEGAHTIELYYDGLPVPGSPYTVNVKRGCDSSKCYAFGPGLEKGKVDVPNVFTVETKGAGTGGLALAIEGPSEAKMACQDNKDGSCTVQYVPLEPGEYEVTIKFGDNHITGSPFKVNVDTGEDSSRVRAWGPGLNHAQIREGELMEFHVDAADAGGKAKLGVDISTEKGPLPIAPVINDKGNGKYDVTYVAPKAFSMLNTKVKYGNEQIEGSPFVSRVKPAVEPEKVRLSGPSLNKNSIPASFPTSIDIDSSDAGKGDLKVEVVGPDGHTRPVKLANNMDKTHTASFVPDDCGKYQVYVSYGEELPDSPYTVQAYATGKADKCKITEGNTRSVPIGEQCCISVNAQSAGQGAITCKIRSSSGSDIDVDIEDNNDGTYNIYYSVKDAGDYTLSIKFGGQSVPDGFYQFWACESDEYVQEEEVRKLNGYQQPVDSDYRPVQLHNIPLPTTGGRVTAEVLMPSGMKDTPSISDNKDGTVSLRYEPREEGIHELVVKYNGDPVQGSPFKFNVDSISSGYVTAYGPGLVHGITGEPASFTVSTKNAGSGSSLLRGGLALAVEGPSKAEITCHDNKDGTVSAAYLPTAPGEYKVSVKFDEKHIKGSPYSVKVTGEGRKRNQIGVGRQSEVSFPGKVKDTEIKSLNASIKSPSGLEEPCFLKKLPDGHLGISFTPREAGEHLVSVKRMGNHIASSPFNIKVSPVEVGDASRVNVSGSGLKEGKTQKENEFKIDTSKAGYGGLSLSIEGPSKAEINCKDNEDGTLTIGYKPFEPGYYIINLKFADNHVHGSPFSAHITGEGSNQHREKMERQREAAPLTEVGSKCRLTFKMPQINAFDLSASVTSPGGQTEAAEVAELEEGLHSVNFVPKELGVHKVSVKYQEAHIHGSPFQFTVGPLRDSGSHRVHVGGSGLERGEQNLMNEFNVWTREAGAGALAISVEGPSKADIEFNDRKDGSCSVGYKVTEPGEYRIGVKFNDKHVPDSPFRVFVTPLMGDARKIEIAQFPDQGTLPDVACQFLILRNGTPYKGRIESKVVYPSGKEEDCFMDRFDDDVHNVTFIPRESGVHNVHVKYEGIHIPGSPFRLRVGKQEGDPGAVTVSGKGIEEAASGQKMDFIVDTCNAGAGTLAVNIDGPSKVSMDCTEVVEGYKVRFTPLTPGDYYIGIKYNGYHIAGSPFKIRCSGDEIVDKGTVKESASVIVETVEKSAQLDKEPQGPVMPTFSSDASKVTSKGLGLKKAHLNRQNNFSINAGVAGPDILYVGVYGPKNPCEEVHIKHVGHNNYNVGYKIRERGDHWLVVRYGGEHIPGSPFQVPSM